ncbi:MAG: ABC transporter permease [Acidimicrobiia bacterium]|nr:ABC transporter permease [Acidimicrobiia bacterium]
MGAVWLTFRAELRRRWRAWLGLALLIGLGAGVVIAATAGARRTGSAYERFLQDQRAYDVIAFPGFCAPEDLAPGESLSECGLRMITGLPQVKDAAVIVNFQADIRTSDGRSLQPGGDPGYTGPGEVSVLGSTDDVFGRVVNRRRVLDGRLPREGAPEEVALSKALAERADVEVGDTLRATIKTVVKTEACKAALEGVELGPECYGSARHRLRVVGIEVSPGELVPPSGNYVAAVHVSRALVRSVRADGAQIQRGLAVTLVDGARGVPAFRRAVEGPATGATVLFRQVDQAKALRGAIRPQVVALELLAALAALAVIAVFGAALGRQAWVESSGYSALWALGIRRRQLVLLTVARAVAIGLIAAPVAALTAFALSPLTPIGLAGDAEPQPGLAVDGLALGAGAALTLVFVVALVLWPAWRIARATTVGDTAGSPARRPSAAATAMTTAGFSAPAVVGVRMALEPGRGRGAVPVRSGFLGVTAGIIALGAALGFGASLAHLLETPRLVGLTWDAAVVFGQDDSTDVDGLTRRIERASGVAGATPGTFVFYPPFPEHPLLLGPRRLPVELLAIGPGVVGPSVIDGRAPVAADEILLATETIDELGLDIGDTVAAIGQVGGTGERPDAGEDTRARFRIVGTGVVPPISGSPETESRLGRGAVTTVPGLQRLNPVATPTALYVQFTPGTAQKAGVAALRRALRGRPGYQEVFDFGGERRDVGGFLDVSEVDDLPLLLGGLVAVVAAGVLAHVLVTSARARRRDLAVLRAIGFRRRQVRSTVTWQAVTVTTVALVIGLPLGLILGRAAWTVYARSIGVVPEPAIAWTGVLAAIIGALLVAVAVAVWPARAAARHSPAAVLRSE